MEYFMVDSKNRGWELRRRAEWALHRAEISLDQIDTHLRHDVVSLLEELRIYQAELEIQNNSLIQAHAESERYRQHYASLFALLPLPALILDHHGVIIESNRQAQQKFGLKTDNYEASQSLYRLLHDRGEPGLKLLLEQSTTGALPDSARIHLNNAAGDPVAYEIYMHPLATDPNHTDPRFLALLADQSTEEALADREQRLADILWGTNVGTWEWNVQTGEVRLNERWAEIVGYRLAELQPVSINTWTGLLHPDDLPASQLAMERHFHGATDTYHFEVRMRHRLGHWVWVLDRGRVIRRTAGGEPLWMSGTCFDITERKQIELDLAKAAAQLREAQRVARLGSWQLDHETQALQWSEQMYQIFEYRPESGALSHERFLAAVHPEDREPLQMAFQNSLSTRQPAQFNYRLLLPDGRIKHVVEQCETEMGADGLPTRSLGTVQDVTGQQVIQRALSALAHQLAPLKGRAFYQGVCEHLMTHLSLDYAFVGCLDTAQSKVRVLSGWTRSGAMEPFVYDLHGTPCALAVQRDSVLYPRAVQTLFRDDPLLGELGIESYMGATLTDKQNQPMGILVCLGRRSLDPGELVLAEQMRDLFVDRINAEMLRSDTESKLRAKSEEFTQYVQNASDLFSVLDFSGRFVQVNPAWEKTLGYPVDAIVGKTYLDFLHPDDVDTTQAAVVDIIAGATVDRFVNRYRHREGGYRWIEWHAQPQHDTIFAVARDISERMEYQHQLEHIAHTDPLTQLPNRILLADRLRHAMAQALRRRNILAVAYLDLDGFKAINDTHGHDRGDEFLQAIAQSLRAALRVVDTLGRLGGDEFVVVMPDLADTKAAEPVFERLLAAAAQSVTIAGYDLQASASIGVTFFPQLTLEIDADQLLRQADQAMYRAKRSGKNRYHVYSSENSV